MKSSEIEMWNGKTKMKTKTKRNDSKYGEEEKKLSLDRKEIILLSSFVVMVL